MRELRALAPARVISTRSATEVPRRDMATNHQGETRTPASLRMRVLDKCPLCKCLYLVLTDCPCRKVLSQKRSA